MKLGFSPFTAGITDYREAFDLAAELGLALELEYDVHEMFPQLPTARELAQMGRAAGVGFTVHLPFVDLNLASLVPAVWRQSVERVQQGLEFASTVGARVGVLHTGMVPVRHPFVVEAALERLRAALEALTPLPVPVAVENLVPSYHVFIDAPETLADLVRAAGDRYGFCLDLGHAFIQGGIEQIAAYLQAMEGRLLHLHVHDNHGVSDDHLALGLGRIPFHQFREELRGFEGTVALEVQGGAEGVRASVRRLREAWDI
ncbi:sugar phosphate isomerase/epimerase family protein [Marinithermus hydrothermalis]|uniref:Xylose isomerase domain-containing protein TIM barrel n=1 Tax=Marinithermus hydrothermalis (strain DSM 14884 / JCM 11576 / T1) TaxID=869210 RepID=F2NR49_MARHT|nr:sugar phosphate isomerase/epimerase family protein [Marinithermus hydrothermalis]AEB12898.1 Xylose isomerase domain-containing protein TIM barrel [Marinithermus hydrothermalis DSM 14884]